MKTEPASGGHEPWMPPEPAVDMEAPGADGSAPASRVAAIARPGLEALYDQHFAFVWRSVKRLGVAESGIDDAVQDVFLVAHRRFGAFEGRSSLRTWLFAIARRVARDHRRTARRKTDSLVPEADAEAQLADPRAPSPLDSATRAEAVRLLQAILDELPEERREVFILAELEQMTAPEIAEALGANLNTVYTRLRAARRDFEAAAARHRARLAWRQP